MAGDFSLEAGAWRQELGGRSRGQELGGSMQRTWGRGQEPGVKIARRLRAGIGSQ